MMWAILFITLPTQPNAVRLRVWRGLKALGCAALRDGAYLLPAQHSARFDALAAEVQQHGGTASVLQLSPRDEAQRLEIEALFDRAEAYAAWRESAATLQAEFATLGETEARRRLRGVAEALHALHEIDFYRPQRGAAADQAAADLSALRQALDARFAKGEPVSRAAHGIARLDIRKHQGKRWATRARPWVDRLACAWLIRRFIDRQPRFVWLEDPTRAPRGALGFDYDGARFSHLGVRVTFEVMSASFGLDSDVRLQRIGQLVRYLDVGGIPVPEAAGVEAVLAGLRETLTDDDRLSDAASAVFDALYAAPPSSA